MPLLIRRGGVFNAACKKHEVGFFRLASRAAKYHCRELKSSIHVFKDLGLRKNPWVIVKSQSQENA